MSGEWRIASVELSTFNLVNMNMDRIGVRSADHYEGITYWTYNWRKKGGSARMLTISKEEEFHMQEYCGCAYSLRDTNKWRMENGREKNIMAKNRTLYGQA